MRTRGMLLMVVLWLGLAVPATAATLKVQQEETWPPGWAEPYVVHHIVYDGDGWESNDVTIAPDAARTGVVLTDPGTPIHVVGGTSPWSCTTPGTSTAACVAAPGRHCWSLYCPPLPGPSTFEGRLKVAGNNGNDRITIEPSNFRSTVWGVYGDDTIDVHNGQPDDVFCHDGLDVVTADEFDWVEHTCEDVFRR